MKLLFFIRSLAIGGSQRQLLMLAEGLEHRGHETAIAVFYTGDAPDFACKASGARVVPLGKKSRWDVAGPLLRLRRLISAERPDFLYAFQPTQTALAAMLLPRRSPTRLIFGIRAANLDFNRYDMLSILSGKMEAKLARRAALIIANSRQAQVDAVARGMPAARIAVVPNGIDTVAMTPNAAARRTQRRLWGIAGEAFVIGYIARFDPMKDHMTLIKAAALFVREYSDAHFVCVGYGPADYLADLKAAAHKLGVAERMVWADAMGDVAVAYNAFDIATLSSSFGESFPNVVGEAMACGIPVAATDVGDVKAIVGEFGEVVPPGQPNALSAAWRRLRLRLQQSPELRTAARAAIVANYSVQAAVQRTEDVLMALLAG